MLVAIPEAPETSNQQSNSANQSSGVVFSAAGSSRNNIITNISQGHILNHQSHSHPPARPTHYKDLHSHRDSGGSGDIGDEDDTRPSQLPADSSTSASISNSASPFQDQRHSLLGRPPPPIVPSSSTDLPLSIPITNSSTTAQYLHLLSNGTTTSTPNGLIFPTQYPSQPQLMNPPPTLMDGSSNPIISDTALQQQLLQLKQEQELQHQLLLQRYQAQKQQLQEAHEKQIQQRLKDFWDLRKREQEHALQLQLQFQLQEERSNRLTSLILKKDKSEQSAVASSEVKQKLQGFLLNKKQQRENSSTTTNNFCRGQNQQPGQGQQGANNFIPGRAGNLAEDFPLRKTASEPNLLKMRLKQRVLDRRSSPLTRRKDKNPYMKRKSYLASESATSAGIGYSGSGGSAGSTPDSGPNSPPVSSTLTSGILRSGDPTPHHEDTNSNPSSSTNQQQPTPPHPLYSSPSLPNISLGKPVGENQVKATKLSAVNENPTPIPNFPYPTTQAEFESAIYQSSPIMAIYQAQAQAAAVAQAAMQAQSQSNGVRVRHPLGRTQSAPLPLGHPMLTVLNQANLIGMRQQVPQMDPHQLLRQHIRQTVLTRVGSRGMGMGINSSVDEGEGEVEEESPEHAAPQDLSIGGGKMVPNIPKIHHRLSHLAHHGPRPLSRALSSPLVAIPNNVSPSSIEMRSTKDKGNFGTGLGFDSLMLKHQCLCGDNSQHPEHPGRLQSIWARLQETGLVNLCERVRSRKATLEEIQTCHTEAHTLLFATTPLSRQRMELSRFPESSLPIKSLVRLPCNGIGVDSDTAWNELHTPSAARMAAGCVIEMAFRVATGDLRNGFAIVRPPGHHAEASQAMGFCFFNSVAIAAKQLRLQLGVEKILILDWDVHHGNGTQQIFYDDPHVLYLSIHRHDEGNFFPGTGGVNECGISSGLGFTVNIGWGGSLNPPMGDAEYLAAFRSVVMPIAMDFQPDIVLVSCGFDAGAGHPAPLGGYNVSPAAFGWMTEQLSRKVAGGKVILCLEGGYDLASICDSSQECVKALLGEPISAIPDEELIRCPCAPAVETLHRVIETQAPHWPVVQRYKPLVELSEVEASDVDFEGRDDESGVSKSMAGLSMSRYKQKSSATEAEHGGSSREQSSVPGESEPMDQDEEQIQEVREVENQQRN